LTNQVQPHAFLESFVIGTFVSSKLGGLRLALFVIGMCQQATAQSIADERHYELIAVDERAGRAVLMDVAGATVVLHRDVETADGLRLKSVSAGSALLEVRFKSPGDVIAYRITLGETVRIHALPEQRSGGMRVIAISPVAPTGAKESSH